MVARVLGLVQWGLGFGALAGGLTWGVGFGGIAGMKGGFLIWVLATGAVVAGEPFTLVDGQGRSIEVEVEKVTLKEKK